MDKHEIITEKKPHGWGLIGYKKPVVYINCLDDLTNHPINLPYSDKPVAYIYTLSHPNTGEIRYVGKTSASTRKRYHRHIRDSRIGTKTHKSAWIRSLILKGLEPVMEVLDVVPEAEWEFWEKYWICQCRAWGLRLTNVMSGGDGVSRGSKGWNGGTKGVMKVNSGSFKKGVHYNTETEIKPGQRLSPKTEFKKGLTPHNIKPVSQYNTDGLLIGVYNSFKEANVATGYDTGTIRRAVKSGKLIVPKQKERLPCFFKLEKVQ